MEKPEIDSRLLLSFLTPPFFLGLTLLQSLEQGLTHLGQMSEEIFRGERLPLLNVPDTPQSSTD